MHMAAICQIRQPALRRARLHGPQSRRWQDQTRSNPGVEATDQQRRLPATRHRRRPHQQLTRRAREDKQERLESRRDRPHIPTTSSSARSLPDPNPRYDSRREPADPPRPATPRNWGLTERSRWRRHVQRLVIRSVITVRDLWAVCGNLRWPEADGAGIPGDAGSWEARR